MALEAEEVSGGRVLRRRNLSRSGVGGLGGRVFFGGGRSGRVGPLRGVGYREPPLGAGRSLPREEPGVQGAESVGWPHSAPPGSTFSLQDLLGLLLSPWLRMWRRERR